MIKLIDYIGEHGKIRRTMLEQEFTQYELKVLPQLVEDKILHSFDMGTGKSYERWYELHNDYKRKLQSMLNNNIGGYKVVTKEWIELEFEPTQNIRRKIGGDIREYTPEGGIKKNERMAHTYSERMKIWQSHQEQSKGTELRIRNKLDEDLLNAVLDAVTNAKEEQKSREQDLLDSIRN